VRGNYEWERTYIREEQRYKDRFTNPQYAHMRGVDQTVTDLPWTFFWAFVPMNALEEALALMTGIGRRAWPDFQLSRHLWFVWLAGPAGLQQIQPSSEAHQKGVVPGTQ